jgi:hypothetical protein
MKNKDRYEYAKTARQGVKTLWEHHKKHTSTIAQPAQPAQPAVHSRTTSQPAQPAPAQPRRVIW